MKLAASRVKKKDKHRAEEQEGKHSINEAILVLGHNAFKESNTHLS